MNELSLERINKSAPYFVEIAKNGFFEFVSDFGLHCSVGFMYDDLLLSHESYQFIVANTNHTKSPSDIKVRNTILSIIDEFFRKNNSTLLYICETGDHKQAMRNRLFQSWFSAYRNKSMFTFLSSSIVDAEGIVNYATVIIRNDHPHYAEVMKEITSTIQLLSQKPIE